MVWEIPMDRIGVANLQGGQAQVRGQRNPVRAQACKKRIRVRPAMFPGQALRDPSWVSVALNARGCGDADDPCVWEPGLATHTISLATLPLLPLLWSLY